MLSDKLMGLMRYLSHVAGIVFACVSLGQQPFPVVKEFEVDVSNLKLMDLAYYSNSSIVKFGDKICALYDEGFILCTDRNGVQTVDIRPRNKKAKLN